MSKIAIHPESREVLQISNLGIQEAVELFVCFVSEFETVFVSLYRNPVMASLEVFFQRFETLLGIVNSMTSWLSVSRPNEQDAASLNFNESFDLYMETVNVKNP